LGDPLRWGGVNPTARGDLGRATGNLTGMAPGSYPNAALGWEGATGPVRKGGGPGGWFCKNGPGQTFQKIKKENSPRAERGEPGTLGPTAGNWELAGRATAGSGGRCWRGQVKSPPGGGGGAGGTFSRRSRDVIPFTDLKVVPRGPAPLGESSQGLSGAACSPRGDRRIQNRARAKTVDHLPPSLQSPGGGRGDGGRDLGFRKGPLIGEPGRGRGRAPTLLRPGNLGPFSARDGKGSKGPGDLGAMAAGRGGAGFGRGPPRGALSLPAAPGPPHRPPGRGPG